MAPDVTHQGVLPSLVCIGRDAVIERIRSSLDNDDSGVDRIELVAAGDRVIVEMAMR